MRASSMRLSLSPTLRHPGESRCHVHPSPNFPLARCEAMGEGGRRPGEGSYELSVAFTKEPSSALSGTFSHAARGRRGK